jgi:hypothetical protein
LDNNDKKKDVEVYALMFDKSNFGDGSQLGDGSHSGFGVVDFGAMTGIGKDARTALL